MTSTPDLDVRQPPSTRTLVVTTAAAMAVAALILITIVLPAEYGVDPLGTGEALGLTPLAGFVEPAGNGEAVAVGEAVTPKIEGPVAHYAAPYKTDSTTFVLGPYEYVEYKYRLEKDATMIYSWAADGGLLHDLHGDRDGAAAAAASESFDKQSRRQASGSFTAPFSGIHGWYWENPGGETITVSLSSAGFFASALEIRFDKSRHPRELTAVKVQ